MIGCAYFQVAPPSKDVAPPTPERGVFSSNCSALLYATPSGPKLTHRSEIRW